MYNIKIRLKALRQEMRSAVADLQDVDEHINHLEEARAEITRELSDLEDEIWALEEQLEETERDERQGELEI